MAENPFVNYVAPPNPFDFSVRWGGAAPTPQWAQGIQTVIPKTVDQIIAEDQTEVTTPTDVYTPADDGGGTGAGTGVGTGGGVPWVGSPDLGQNPGNPLIEIRNPFAGIIRKGVEEDETSYGGTYEDVIDKRNEIAANPSNEYYDLLPPAAPAPGSSQEEAHAVVTQAEDTYAKVLQDPDIPADVKAALNPAFNPELAEAARDVTVGVGNLGGARSPIGITKKAADVLTKDFDKVNDQYNTLIEIAEESGDSDTADQLRQDKETYNYQAAGATVNAAGVSNIGGKFNQSGDNAGLPDDYLIVGSSDGTQEVWGPDGKTYDSVSDAKAAITEAAAKPITTQIEGTNAVSINQGDSRVQDTVSDAKSSGGNLHDYISAGANQGISASKAAILYEQNKGESKGQERQERQKFADDALAKIQNTAVTNIDPNDRSITKLGKKAAAAKAKELGLSIPGDEGGQALSRAIKDAQGLQKLSQDLDSAQAAARSKTKAQAYLKSLGYPQYDKDTAPDILRQKIREASVAGKKYNTGGYVKRNTLIAR